MKSLSNLLIITLLVLAYLEHPVFQEVLTRYLRIAQFVLVLYVLYILLNDFLKTLKKKIIEKFGMRFKIFKRKLKKLRPF